jgi:hypothetical protein
MKSACTRRRRVPENRIQEEDAKWKEAREKTPLSLARLIRQALASYTAAISEDFAPSPRFQTGTKAAFAGTTNF